MAWSALRRGVFRQLLVAPLAVLRPGQARPWGLPEFALPQGLLRIKELS